ncbi:MAG TPA: phosphoglucomutase/phosphomannomutase family protein [Bacteroides sp.]|nr:phosphoglucomutase/phosphomannomutase family protein [Bacteroides sp.]
MDKIKFGTDGWRGVIAHQFTVANVAKVTNAAAIWLLNKFQNPEVIVGYDTRFQGKLFAETVCKVLASKGIKVSISDDFVSTPMVSLAVREWKASLGIMITASHNNYTYSGYKLKGSYGGPLLSEELKNIEDLISAENNLDIDLLNWDNFVEQELIRYADLEAFYTQYIGNYFDLDSIRSAGIKIGFEAMYGSAQKVIKKLLPDARYFHCEMDPTFGNIPPEPLEKNLQELLESMRSKKDLDVTIAVDGDADRIALVNRGGRYIDSHTIILILIHYLANYRKMKGKVVTGFSSTMKVEKLSRHYDLEVMRVPIGFKDICRVMLNEDVLVGGEESGGISIRGYLPERDGIWMGLTILQFMAETGKSLDEILDEIFKITGSFHCVRRDIQIPKDKRGKIMDLCYKGEIESFGKFRVTRIEALDGIKFFFSDDAWVMIRASGTEPLLRTYAEAANREIAEEILEAAGKTIAAIVK